MTGRPLILGPLFVAGILGTILCLFWPTAYELVEFEVRNAAYTHRALVVPAFLVIVWRQRAGLSTLPIRPFWFGLPGLIGAGMVWLTGELAYMRVLTDIAIVAMVPMAVLTVLGYRWLSYMIFPLSILLFAIPIEGPLVPILVDWTAKFAVMGIQASGVPILREGAYFTIPTGAWSVADTCSGIAFFTTSLMLGVLYAWTMYRTALKRVVFVTGAVVIGIVGNWIRVYLTVMIAHLSDNRFLRDDHYSFGWLLYAVFLFGYGWLGWIYRDQEPQEDSVTQPDRETGGRNSLSREQASGWRIFAVSTAALAALLVWPLVEMALASNQQSRAIDIADIAPQQGWSPVANPSVQWKPTLKNPSRERVQAFEKAGQRVDVFFGIFRDQTWTSKLVSSVNRLADSDNHDWSLIDRGTALTEFSGKSLRVDSGILLGRGVRLVAWRWYWIDNVATASDIGAKIQQMLARLRGSDDTSAWIAISTQANVSRDNAIKTLEEFMRDMGGSMERALEITARR